MLHQIELVKGATPSSSGPSSVLNRNTPVIPWSGEVFEEDEREYLPKKRKSNNQNNSKARKQEEDSDDEEEEEVVEKQEVVEEVLEKMTPEDMAKLLRGKLAEAFQQSQGRAPTEDEIDKVLEAYSEVVEQRKETKVDSMMSFVCSITQDQMSDPVTCMDGHTYERSGIERWLEDHDTSPLTGAKLPSKNLIPNHSLRNAIEEWNKVSGQ